MKAFQYHAPGISVDAIKSKIKNVLKQIEEEDFIPFFESLKDRYSVGLYNKSFPPIKVVEISTKDDLSKIPNQRGFYLIFTDYKSGCGNKNKCKAHISDNSKAKVIYRGESYNVRTRIESHLFHNTYHKKRQKNSKRNDNYTVCLGVRRMKREA